ncbi:MAG: hypothetical protein J5518_10815 [Lachnospiraceae bacterium]|nr:hypothetical protein [Lachnospiraceae bacterium]
MMKNKRIKRILTLIAVLLIAVFSVTACGGRPADAPRETKQNEPEESNPQDEAKDDDSTITADAEAHTVHLNSKASRGPGYVSVNETFTNQKGNSYQIFMFGLKEENRDAMLEALSLYYDAESTEGLTIYDDAFADAEKYDDEEADPDNDSDDDSDDDSDEDLDNDSDQCWAGAVADMLWVTGWAEKLQNPITGSAFSSEDDVFRYYNRKISNYGVDHPSTAVDYLFMGEFYMPPSDSGAGAIANVLDPGNPDDGLMKQFVSSYLMNSYDLIADPDQISALEHCGQEGSDATDFQASIGTLTEGELVASEHAVSAIGVITDPNAGNSGDRYKAILIVDPDNDAKPSEADGVGENPTLEQRDAAKEARPNSVTVYNLKYTEDTNNTPYWLIEGAHMDEEEGAALYSLTEIPQYHEDIIAEYTETEGTQAAYNSVDMTPELLFTTSETEAIDDFFGISLDDVTVTDFSSGDAINLNFFIANRGDVVLNEDYLGDKRLSVDWSVVRDDDGSAVAGDTFIIEDHIYDGETNGYLINLNQNGEKVEAWDPGDYTVTLDLNADRSVPEAYFLNNQKKEYHFTVE